MIIVGRSRLRPQAITRTSWTRGHAGEVAGGGRGRGVDNLDTGEWGMHSNKTATRFARHKRMHACTHAFTAAGHTYARMYCTTRARLVFRKGMDGKKGNDTKKTTAAAYTTGKSSPRRPFKTCRPPHKVHHALAHGICIMMRNSSTTQCQQKKKSTLGRPMGRSISGRNMPLLPISVHFLRSGWYPKISIDGSVYGLYAGLKRI